MLSEDPGSERKGRDQAELRDYPALGFISLIAELKPAMWGVLKS